MFRIAPIELQRGVAVLGGVAAPQMTAVAAAEYRAAGGLPGSRIWLSPAPILAQAARAQLLDSHVRVCAQPSCFTFDQLAQRVLKDSGNSTIRLSGAERREILRELTQAAAAAGELRVLRPIADTPGLLDQVDAFVEHLRRRGISAADYEAATRAASGGTKDRELARLYAVYERALKRKNLADLPAMLSHAAAALGAGAWCGTGQLKLAVVNGFTEFSAGELEILDALVGQAEKLVICLPLEEDSPRADLFASSQATLERLKVRHPTLQYVRLDGSADRERPAMAALGRNLFHYTSHPSAAGDSEELQVVATAGRVPELRWLARTVKQLLSEGDAQSGAAVAPDEIVVVDFLLEQRADIVRQLLREYGIPAAVEQPRPLGSWPAGSLLTSALRLHLDDWPLGRLLATIGNGLLDPAWLEWDGGRAAQAADYVVRQLALNSGREDLLRCLAAWSAGGGSGHAGERSARRRKAQQALPFLKRLGEVLAALPDRATCGQWAEAIHNLAGQLGLLGDTDVERAAWRRLDMALRAGDRAAQWLGGRPRELRLDQLCARLDDIFEHEPLPRSAQGAGRVRVLAPSETSAFPCNYLFLAGLEEASARLVDREDELHGQGETERLIEAGLPLGGHAERTSREMLRFYNIVTSARRRLWLSYPALDAKAQPLSPSPYLLEVERASGVASRKQELELSPVPRSAEIFGERDFRIKATAQSLKKNIDLLVSFCGSDARRPAGRNLLAALGTAHARATGETFGAYEGIVLSAKAKAALGERFGPDHTWSTSNLDQISTCPYQFFLQRVLKIEPSDSGALETDFALRGRILHGVLATLLRRVNRRAGKPCSPCAGDAEALLAEAGDVLEGVRASLRCDSSFAEGRNELNARAVSKLLARYFEQHRSYEEQTMGLTLLPTHFEVAFGTGADRDELDIEAADGPALSTARPLELDCGEETLRISGRIDRIDVGQIGGQTVFNVVDYKSGSSAAFRGKLQLLIYALAVEELLMKDQQALAWGGAYWFVKEKGYAQDVAFHERVEGELRPTDDWQSLRTTVTERVRALVEQTRQGHFPMQNDNLGCTRFCEYQTVCRVRQVRALGKTWPPSNEAERAQ